MLTAKSGQTMVAGVNFFIMELTKEIIEEAIKLIGDGHKCPIAKLMKQKGFDPNKGDFTILPKSIENEVRELFSYHIVPKYVRFSDFIDKGYFMKNLFSIERMEIEAKKNLQDMGL